MCFIDGHKLVHDMVSKDSLIISINMSLLSPTVPTIPLEFSLENVTDEPNQLLASWMKPQPPNGVITSYGLFCTLSSNQVYRLGDGDLYTYLLLR